MSCCAFSSQSQFQTLTLHNRHLVAVIPIKTIKETIMANEKQTFLKNSSFTAINNSMIGNDKCDLIFSMQFFYNK